MSTLFLNFPFWYVHGLDLPIRCLLPLYAAPLAVASLLIAALFFMGPALATHALERPLFHVLQNSLGSIPAFALRLCCVLFLVLWIADMIAVPVLWLSPFILRRNVSAAESGIIAAAILIFLFITGLQSLRTSAKLALFTNKLGVALLVAALIRVHQGWPAALKGFPSSASSPASDLWHGLSLLGFYVAPLALLAANFGCRSAARKQVGMTALMGIAVPLFGTLLFVGVIAIATFHSQCYRPSLNPNVAMALWGGDAGSAVAGPMMLAAITMFGAVRFGTRALAYAVPIRAPGSRLGWVLLVPIIGATVWASLNQDDPRISAVLEGLVGSLAVAGAVLTADVVIGKRLPQNVRKVDWVGVTALLAGLAAPFHMPHAMFNAAADSWWHPWLLPSYGAGFLVCLLGRVVQRTVFGTLTSPPGAAGAAGGRSEPDSSARFG
jgi:hypothetical protein